jgi:hypothetical protein
MSLIHTCQLNGANSFQYLTELQRHAAQVAANPSQWMPWSYRETLVRTAGISSPPECLWRTQQNASLTLAGQLARFLRTQA